MNERYRSRFNDESAARITWKDRSEMERHHFLIYAMLSIINSPAVFHRERHEPHRAVAREAKAKGLGKINDWHKKRGEHGKG